MNLIHLNRFALDSLSGKEDPADILLSWSKQIQKDDPR